jgi:hypothetical protein
VTRYPQGYPPTVYRRPQDGADLPGLPHPPSDPSEDAVPPSPPSDPARQPLLARLDALVDLAHRANGLLLAPDGQLTRTDAVAAANAVGIEPGPGRGRGALELLLLLGIAVGILRADGLRVRAAPLHDAWRHLDDTLRAGLLYAAWCHRVPWPGVLGEPELSGQLQARRVRALRLLHDLPSEVEVSVDAFAATVADHAGLLPGPPARRCVVAAFLDPLAALGVAWLAPGSPAPAAGLRLGRAARTVIGAALAAAGEPVQLRTAEAN